MKKCKKKKTKKNSKNYQKNNKKFKQKIPFFYYKFSKQSSASHLKFQNFDNNHHYHQ